MQAVQAETTGRKEVRRVAIPLVIVGIWGGIVPFAGPSFHYSMGGGGSWVWSESHATLHLAPAIAAVIGALVLLGGRRRGVLRAGGLVAMVGGIWFVIGPSLQPLWAGSGSGSGMMMMGGSAGKSALESIGYHYGTGVIITALAAFALGMLSSRRAVAGNLPARHLASERASIASPPTMVDA